MGQHVVVGGWVKSSKEKEVEKSSAPSHPLPMITSTEDAVGGGKKKDVSCVEILQSRIPLIRSIMDVFGGSGYGQRKKRETVSVPSNNKVVPPKASTAFLLLTDGSCVQSLQVCALFVSAFFFSFLECVLNISNNTYKHCINTMVLNCDCNELKNLLSCSLL